MKADSRLYFLKQNGKICKIIPCVQRSPLPFGLYCSKKLPLFAILNESIAKGGSLL